MSKNCISSINKEDVSNEEIFQNRRSIETFRVIEAEEVLHSSTRRAKLNTVGPKSPVPKT